MNSRIFVSFHTTIYPKAMHIRKRGKTYLICISMGFDSSGKRIRQYVTYDPDPTLTPRQANHAAYNYGIEIENKLKRGGTIQYEALTFNQFAEMYFRDFAPTLKEYTAVQYKDIYEKRFKPYFGNMRIKNIRPLDIRQWLTAMERLDKTGKLTENSKGVYFRTLSSMLGVAYRWELIDNNPCRRIRAPRDKQSTVKALQQSDFDKLFAKIDSFPDSRAVLLIYLLSSTGMREGEAAGLKWQDINFENRTISIEREVVHIPRIGLRVTSPKSINSIREICVPELLCDKLSAYKDKQNKDIAERGNYYNDEGYIFTQFNGSPVHSSSIREWTKKAFEYCDVPYITVHGLRHTYASILISNGADPRTTAAQLGHSTPSLTINIYCNPQYDAKRRAGDLIGIIIASNHLDK